MVSAAPTPKPGKQYISDEETSYSAAIVPPGVRHVFSPLRLTTNRAHARVSQDEQDSGIDTDRLKDPATFTRCMASLGLDLEVGAVTTLSLPSFLFLFACDARTQP